MATTAPPLSRSWVKSELNMVLETGLAGEGDKSSNIRQPGPASPPRRPRLNRSAKIAMRRLVQCIEVDEKLNALKINDEETAVWCFVTAPAMKNFKGCRTNPSFASLNSTTITIENWEFSTFSVVCPTFDEAKAKANGHICILVNQFGMHGGERLTTFGKPKELGDGNRDLRVTLRSIDIPKQLVRVLAAGQGLPCLRDINAVLIHAPASATGQSLKWSDVEPSLLEPVPVTTANKAIPPAISALEAQPGATADVPAPPSAAVAAAGRASPAATRKGSGGESGADSVTRSGGNPVVETLMSQQSLGMEYDEEGQEGEDGFRTQAQSIGNVFSQEPMEMRPASPSPTSPPSASPAASSPRNHQPMSQQHHQHMSQQSQEFPASLDGASSSRPAEGDADDYDDLPLGQQEVMGGGKSHVIPRSLAQQETAVAESPAVTRSVHISSHRKAAGGVRMDGKSATPEKMDMAELLQGVGKETQSQEEGYRDEEGEEESSGEVVPAGFTQLEVLPDSQQHGQQQHEDQQQQRTQPQQPQQQSSEKQVRQRDHDHRGIDEDEEDEEEDKRRRKFMANGSRSRWQSGDELDNTDGQENDDGDDSPPPTWKGKGKGKARARPRAAVDTHSSNAADAAGSALPIHDSLNPTFPQLSPAEESGLSQELSGHTLSGQTSSSSNIVSPKSGRLGLTCLTQARRNEDFAHPGSGARATANKFNVSRMFAAGGGGGGDLADRTSSYARGPCGESSSRAKNAEDDYAEYDDNTNNHNGTIVASTRDTTEDAGEGRRGARRNRSCTDGWRPDDRSSSPHTASPDTVEMEVVRSRESIEREADSAKMKRRRNAAAEASTRKVLPARLANLAATKFRYPVRCGPVPSTSRRSTDRFEKTERRGRKRHRPLSDLIVEVDPAWNGKGERPPVIARGYDACPLLAAWLDEDADRSPGEDSPPPNIDEWMEKVREAAAAATATTEARRRASSRSRRDYSGRAGASGGGARSGRVSRDTHEKRNGDSRRTTKK